MSGRLHEFAVFAGIATPEEWKVPKDETPYIVIARNSTGMTHWFPAKAKTNQPEHLREVIYGNYPDTVDYSFRETTREQIHEYGRLRALETSAHRVISQFVLMQELGK